MYGASASPNTLPRQGSGAVSKSRMSIAPPRPKHTWLSCAVSVDHSADVAERSTKSTDPLTLDNVRSSLIRQEDTIIFSLIERAQFALNQPVYAPGAVPVPAFLPDGSSFSLLEYVLRDTETCQGKIRRYTSPDEHPFYPEAVPPMVLPPLAYRSILHQDAQSINFNATIMKLYLNKILPGICQPGDDSNYGSAATYDVLCLQALSKRIHYGKFVAEAKFAAAPDDYSQLIRDQDADSLMDLLTFPFQEARVVERVRGKAATFGQDVDADGKPTNTNYKVMPEVVADLYRDVVMPLTKDVQVAYLLRRLD